MRRGSEHDIPVKLTPKGAGSGPGRREIEVRLADVPAEGALVLPSQRCAIVRRDGDSLVDR